MTELVPLKRLAEISYGLGQPPRLSDEGVPILRATNIHRGKFLSIGLIFAALEDLPLDRAPLLRSGEVLVVRSGAYTGDSALVTEDWAGSAPGYDLRITPSSSLDPRFLAYSLLGRLAMDHIAVASSRAAQPHLNAEDLGDLPVLGLSLGRQQAIADYLDIETVRIDALIAKKTRLVALTRERARAIHSRAYLALETYPAIRLGTVARIFSGTGFPPSLQGASAGDLPFFKVSDFSLPGNKTWLRTCTNWVSSETRLSLGARMTPGGAVLFPKVGAALLGNARRITAQPSMFDNNVMAVVPQRHSGEFMHFVLSQVDLGELANPGPVPSVNEDTIAALRVPAMSSEEQDQVLGEVRRATAWTAKVAGALERQLELLREHRQVLITAAVTGELEIPGAA